MTKKGDEPTSILIIDDDPIVRRVLTRRLEGLACAVATASDGREGVRRAAEIRPAVILTDWMMPEMDGQAVLEAVRADPVLRSCYVVVLTARDNPADRVAGLELGADDYLAKPWADAELLARVRTGLRVQALQRDLARAEHKAALLTMAATLGHEINNPLTVLTTAIQLARSRPPSGDGLHEFLDRCERQAARMARVVTSLTELTEPRTTAYVGSRTMLDLSGIAAGAGSDAMRS
jgi:DNA-binding response OmpR family regulator